MLDIAYRIVRKEEGGLAHIPGDSGGLTNFGITQRVYDEYLKLRNMANQPVSRISESEVEEIYNRYWKDSFCDNLKWPLNVAHFAFCFNAGITPGIKMLQRALDLKEDGIFGPKTSTAVNVSCNNKDGCYVLAYRLMLEQVFFYDSLDENNPTKTKFVTNFWLKRIRNIFRQIDKADKREDGVTI